MLSASIQLVLVATVLVGGYLVGRALNIDATLRSLRPTHQLLVWTLAFGVPWFAYVGDHLSTTVVDDSVLWVVLFVVLWVGLLALAGRVTPPHSERSRPC